MKPKELICIFIVIVIIYFIYTYFIEKKEPFIGKINESFRSNSRSIRSVITNSYNSLVGSSKRIIRKTGIF
jgi:hypothetical protein